MTYRFVAILDFFNTLSVTVEADNEKQAWERFTHHFLDKWKAMPVAVILVADREEKTLAA